MFTRLRDVSTKTTLSKIDVMELARVYDKVKKDGDNCFREETVPDYLKTLETMLDIRYVIFYIIQHLISCHSSL